MNEEEKREVWQLLQEVVPVLVKSNIHALSDEERDDIVDDWWAWLLGVDDL